MKTKKVNRYYCDYCKKSGCNSYWIKKHENRCTLNPDRYCGYCHLLGKKQSNLVLLLSILPNPQDYEKTYLNEDNGFTWSSYVGLDDAVDAVLPKLRDAAENCPACIMAALRQKKIPVQCATNFNFSEETQTIWNEFNAEQMRKEQESEYSYLI